MESSPKAPKDAKTQELSGDPRHARGFAPGPHQGS